MDRRLTLRLLMSGVVWLAGCVTNTTRPLTMNYDTHLFDHGQIEGPLLDEGLRYTDTPSEHRYYGTLVTKRAAVDRFDRERLQRVDSAAVRFIDETVFTDALLLVFQSFPASSHPDFTVERLEREDQTLLVDLGFKDEGWTDDITVKTLLVRLGIDPATPLTAVVVTTPTGERFSFSA